jgi:hypothetical protein
VEGERRVRPNAEGERERDQRPGVVSAGWEKEVGERKEEWRVGVRRPWEEVRKGEPEGEREESVRPTLCAIVVICSTT